MRTYSIHSKSDDFKMISSKMLKFCKVLQWHYSVHGYLLRAEMDTREWTSWQPENDIRPGCEVGKAGKILD